MVQEELIIFKLDAIEVWLRGIDNHLDRLNGKVADHAQEIASIKTTCALAGRTREQTLSDIRHHQTYIDSQTGVARGRWRSWLIVLQVVTLTVAIAAIVLKA